MATNKQANDVPKKKRTISEKTRKAFAAFRNIKLKVLKGEPITNDPIIKDAIETFGAEKIDEWVTKAQEIKRKADIKKGSAPKEGLTSQSTPTPNRVTETVHTITTSPETVTVAPETQTAPTIQPQSQPVQPSAPPIDLETIKKAVNECIGGQCDLLNSLKKDVANLKSETKEIAALKSKIEALPDSITTKTSDDIGGLAKQMLAAMAEMRKESKKPERPGPAPSPPEAKKEELPKTEEVKAEAKPVTEVSKKEEKPENTPTPIDSPAPETTIPLDIAISDPGSRKEVLDILKDAAEKDVKFKQELIGLAAKCQAGDDEACEILGKKEVPFSLFTDSNPLKEKLFDE